MDGVTEPEVRVDVDADADADDDADTDAAAELRNYINQGLKQGGY